MANTITFTDITNHSVIQRNGIVGAINVSGGFDNSGTTPVTIESQIINYNDSVTIISDWTPINSIVVGVNFWNGIANKIPQGGPYKINFRSKSGVSIVATGNIGTHQFCVGDLFIVAGSSTADHFFWDGSYTLTQSGCRRYYTTNVNGIPAGGQVWSQFPATGNGAAVNFCNKMGATLGVPIGLCGFGVGASYLDVWQAGQTNYTTMVNGISALGRNIKGIFFVILNDLGNGNVFSESNWESRYKNIINNTRNIFNSVNPTIPIIIMSYPPVTAAGSDTDATYVLRAEQAISIYNTSNTLLIWRNDRQLNSIDLLHPSTSGILDDSERMVRTWLWWAGKTNYYQGPKVTNAWYSGTTVNVNIAHTAGTDITPSSGITCWNAVDNGGALTVSNVSRFNPATIQFMVNRAITGTLKVQHAWVANPDISSMIHDNASPLSLPLEPCEIIASSGNLKRGVWI